jgi:hypothetical protein
MELTAATTLGSSIHIGTEYSFSLILRLGTTARGRESFPITFYIIEFAFSVVIPPELSKS